MLAFDGGLRYGLSLVGKWGEELEDYEFIVFMLQPNSRAVESELRASVPVSPEISSVDPKVSLPVLLHIDVRIAYFLEVEASLEYGRVLGSSLTCLINL